MYRRLITFGVAVCAVALTALLIPLALAARDVAQIQEIGEAAALAHAGAAAWERAEGTHGGMEDRVTQPPVSDPSLTFFPPEGPAIGAAPRPDSRGVVEQARAGNAATDLVSGWGYAASPAYFSGGHVGVVLVTMSPADMREDLWPRLFAIAGVSALLLCIAALASWRLARRTVAPLTALTHTADRVAEGDLTARAAPTTVPEIDQVGRALNRLTSRVGELLQEQRSETAELAHQLRTPLTVLSVDVDGVTDDTVRDRLLDDLGSVHRMVDEIIDNARRPAREGLVTRCDAAAILADRVRFWRVLAEDQGRALTTTIPAGSVWIRLTAEDLATAVDILLQNVFVHTPEGTALSVVLEPGDPWVAVSVTDHGPGLGQPEPANPGSTGLGLSIAARVAHASGGRLQFETTPVTKVTLMLGRAPVD